MLVETQVWSPGTSDVPVLGAQSLEIRNSPALK